MKSFTAHDKGERSRKARITWVLVAVVALLTFAPAWAINKCTGADGKVVFQDLPCAGQGEKMDVRPASGYADEQDAQDAQAVVQKLQADNQMAEAIRTHEPLVGMTRAQLQEAMGTPTKVNANNYGGVQEEQMIYERPIETWYVYTRAGVVTSIQHRPGPPIGARTRNAERRCPTQHEIKDAITSAGSIALSTEEKAARWRVIREMQACGRR